MSKRNLIFITFVYIVGLHIICAQNANAGQKFEVNTDAPVNGIVNQENAVTLVPTKLGVTTDSIAVSSLNTTTMSNIVVPPPSSTKSISVPVKQVSEAPSTGTWQSECIMIQMAAQLSITYETTDNKTNTTLYNLPKNANSTDSTCGNETQQLVLEWGPSAEISSLTIEFRHDAVKKEYSIFELFFKIQTRDNDIFPNASDNQVIQLLHIGDILKTPDSMSYECKKQQNFDFNNTINNGNNTKPAGKLFLQNVRYEAFRKNITKFSSSKNCEDFDTPDIVPVAVGCALVFLIVAILISYLYVRRRSTARGYMSF